MKPVERRGQQVRQAAGLLCLTVALVLLSTVMLSAVRLHLRSSEPERFAASGRQAEMETPIRVWLDGAVDPNTANVNQLTALPGIGPVLAQAIVEERESGGSFVYPEDLLAVKGIGKKRLASIYELLSWGRDEEEQKEVPSR